ncbi:leucine-rich repeat domain-containing protein [Enterococcus sp. AZ012]|uniref:leucine-rich repeat domain-containing protein n=1 Tax=unclassified Enterococcus TaxID=2608891 RepID=UPI003D2E6A96
MKKTLIISTALLGMISLSNNLSISYADEATPYLISNEYKNEIKIDFADQYLEEAVKASLGLQHSEDVTEENILELRSLEWYNGNISDLTGLEHAINLSKVTLTGNNISSLQPLVNLENLTSIGLSNNPIAISEVLLLDNVLELDLSGNHYGEEINELAKYTKMTNLWLNDCGLTNIDFVQGMDELIWLRVMDNQITSLNSLNSNSLTGLWATNNVLTTLEDISSFGSLRGVYLEGNQLKSIDVLQNVSTLERIYADNNNISSVNMSNNDSLQYIYLNNNSISMLNLNNMRSLLTFDGRSNNIRHLDGLSKIPSLKQLYLYNNEITDLSGLETLSTLTLLQLQSNQNIEDFTPINSLQNLNSLYMNDTGIENSDIESIGELPLLQELGVAKGNLKNIDFITQFPSLNAISLDENHLSDISTLPEGIFYSAVNQTITLPASVLGTSTEFSLKDIDGGFDMETIDWQTKGNLTLLENGLVSLTWNNIGENSFNFLGNYSEQLGKVAFSGRILQLVN